MNDTKKDVEKTEIKPKRKFRLKPAQQVVLGFVAAILIGAFLLSLPISSKSGKWMSFIDAIFTATSAISTTGLSVVGDTSTYFSTFGQIVLLLLIQVGGVGIMSLTTLFLMLLKKKITLRDRIAIKTEFGQKDNRGMVKLGRNILLMSIAIEGVGFLILIPPFVIRNGGIGVWQALFTSVSAFCNAGFDVMGVTQGAGTSLIGFSGDVTVNLTVALLIILGGFGFTVLMDIGKNKWRFKKYALHSKIVIITSGALILLGWVFYLAVEFNNPNTFGDMNVGEKILAAFFQSVTPRSTGFATVDQASMYPASKFMTMFLMFIGASPASTGGGIRTSTLAVLILVTIAGIRGSGNVNAGKRKIPVQSERKAISVFLTSFAIVLIVALVMLISENGKATVPLTLENVLFESFSAFTTAGLSVGLCAETLSVLGKILLSLLMFFGRVGTVSVAVVFLQKNVVEERVGYPDADILIG